MTDQKTADATPASADTDPTSRHEDGSGRWTSLISPVGYILAVSYPLLALSTGARALYQLFLKEGVTDPLPALMSGVAALCYLTATVGFVYRRRWSWWLSVGVLTAETFLTLLVGTISYISPTLFGRTVWRHFGEDYGYFPLFQPLIGLAWLLLPATLRAYGIAALPGNEGNPTLTEHAE